jgi:hypothetical protein
MPSLAPNPNAEAQVAFDTIAAGTYRVRVKSVDEFVAQSGNTCWRFRFDFVDPSSLTTVQGQPAQNPGSLIDSRFVVNPADGDTAKAQGQLRGFVEKALGLEWASLTDSDTLIGQECLAVIAVGEWKGSPTNEIKRYLPVE